LWLRHTRSRSSQLCERNPVDVGRLLRSSLAVRSVILLKPPLFFLRWTGAQSPGGNRNGSAAAAANQSSLAASVSTFKIHFDLACCEARRPIFYSQPTPDRGSRDEIVTSRFQAKVLARVAFA
jgi:hypothetical protein